MTMGIFGPATRAAVGLQDLRGLRVDGVWAARRGIPWSRPVSGRRPFPLPAAHAAGDDVADLQRRLGTLGFDTGRVDGIFGPETSGPWRNSSSTPGSPSTASGGASPLQAAAAREPPLGAELVTAVRARAGYATRPPTLRPADRCRRVGGLGRVDGARRALFVGGIQVTSCTTPMNRSRPGPTSWVPMSTSALGWIPDPGCRTSFWAGHHDESPGGRRLAEWSTTRPRGPGIDTAGSRDAGAHLSGDPDARHLG